MKGAEGLGRWPCKLVTKKLLHAVYKLRRTEHSQLATYSWGEGDTRTVWKNGMGGVGW